MASVAAIVYTISDEKALSLFKAAGLSENNGSSIVIKKLKINRKQFYSIMKKLIDAGLIERNNGKYRLTSFGKVVFSMVIKAESAVKNYWKLKAIDSIMISEDRTEVSAEEYQLLIDKLIDNQEIKAILVSNKN